LCVLWESFFILMSWWRVMLSTEKIIPGISDNKAIESSFCIFFVMLPRWKDEMQSLDASALVRRHHYPLRLPPQICGRYFGIYGRLVSLKWCCCASTLLVHLLSMFFVAFLGSMVVIHIEVDRAAVIRWVWSSGTRLSWSFFSATKFWELNEGAATRSSPSSSIYELSISLVPLTSTHL
jgi:hypothetical protein